MKGMLTDVTKCIGCERCVEACVRKNKLPRDFLAHFTGKDGLSGNRFTSIVKTPGPVKGKPRSVRRHCMHCLEPACAAACLVGAFTKSADGAVVYDDSKCIGCRYCMLACAFSIPRYQYDKPLPYIRKCRMDERCRVKGGLTACTSACPTGATIFGPREELIKEARRRIAAERIAAEPGKYIDHIFGETEFGGTSGLYISDVPIDDVIKMPSKDKFKKWRVSRLETESIPSMIEPWVWVTPAQFVAVSAGLAGVWAIKRRNKLMNPPPDESDEHATEDNSKGGNHDA